MNIEYKLLTFLNIQSLHIFLIHSTLMISLREVIFQKKRISIKYKWITGIANYDAVTYLAYLIAYILWLCDK